MSVNNLSQEQAKTREEYKKAKNESQQKINVHEKKANGEKAATQKNKRVRIRLIPIWLRLLLLIIFILVGVTSGAAVGYGVLGDGKVADIFKESTWTHIRDLVDKGK
ncbi:DNA-directed RNA polymerase subunit beta [Neobacillus novalis]|uniref:DNA-directed RNA polymerase subunit beta n=1 Tax=Neobacillus novalis TaxID=220687 RepID=A0AA95MQB9_9BACI|nr:DNA-directed RNA polymerase subunit beta [Neobacillus novalis]WHY86123.1 DNA-directed RNA polymerase subunit beta [Neobacillus novalis]